MTSFAANISIDPLAQNFDWASLESTNATIVDIGGGWGPASIGLAQRFPGLNFVVQDLTDVISDGPNHVPSELQNRITFMAASCLEEQSVKGAAVYFLRAVLHNFPDEYIVRILRNQTKGKVSLSPTKKQLLMLVAMTTNARIIINETVLDNSRDDGRNPYQVKFQRLEALFPLCK